jgi:hypothetical protein
MNKTAYWIIWLLLTAFAVVGIVLIDVPQTASTNASDFVQFFRSQYVTAAVLGLVIGTLLGWLASRRIYHQPRERGSRFTARVTWRGLISALFSALITAVLVLVYASVNPIQPLAPLGMVIAVASNGLFYVVLAIAMLATMFTFSIATRMPSWGGQYALIKRF